MRYPEPISEIDTVDIPAESVTSIDVAAAPTPNDVDPIPAIVDDALTMKLLVQQYVAYPAQD